VFNSEGFNQLNFNTLSVIVSWYRDSFPVVDPNAYHLMYDTDIVPIQYIGEQHSYANNPWSPHRGFDANHWLYTSDLELFFAGSDGYVYRFGVGDTDDGDKIDAYYVTKYIDVGVPDRIKRARWLDVDAEVMPGSILQVYYRIDNESEWRQLTEIDQGSGRYIFTEMPKTAFRKIAFKFMNGYPGCTFRINGFALDVVIHGQQKEIIK
jgi:hypothetical protein